ncbi:dynein axonemal heavy chain 6 [Onthophagus taurus]|uniref:dynein axonemal heavy chain 6 n=1 Tax=Onthophagus taurus TaxID=166361 RepID=UPI000C20DF73|nr:dynein heavy chain 6, axonemal [Onthophagus taurus]
MSQESVDSSDDDDGGSGSTLERGSLESLRKTPMFFCRPPERFKRKANIIPFHVPHKKLLEKLEKKVELPEPLTGFRAHQQKILDQRAGINLVDGDLPSAGSRTPSDASISKQKAQTISLRKKPKKDQQLKFRDTGVRPVVNLESHMSIGGGGAAGDIVLPHFRLKNVVLQTSLIQKLRSGEIPGFVYLIYAVPRSSEHYTPYALTMVPYENIDQNLFLTMSAQGVLQHHGLEQVFTPLEKWEAEYNLYCRLMRINTFFNFRIWKAFYVWHKTIIFNKIARAKKNLSNNLFILNPLLGPALLNIRNMCEKMADFTFADVSNIENWELFYFIEAQMGKLEEIIAELVNYRNVTKEIIYNACLGALLGRGFIVDETIELETEKSKSKKGKAPKASFIEQSEKKNFCIRLTYFITLTDYLTLNMMHGIVSNSATGWLKTLETHLKYLPSVESIQGTPLDKQIMIPRSEDDPQLPLLRIRVIINETFISLDPTHDVTANIFNQVWDLWESQTLKIKSFLGDKLYNSFTCPIINGKVEDRLCGFGPPLFFYLSDDQHLKAVKKTIFDHIRLNYDVADVFVKRLEYIREFFAADKNTPPSIIEDEIRLEVFRELCIRFHEEINIINSTVDKQPLGIHYLQLEDFKTQSLPESTRLLNILENVLPRIGRDNVNRLADEVEYSAKYLERTNTETLQFVEYFRFLEKCTERIDVMESDLEYCKELYDMTEEYSIPVPGDDMSKYLGISVDMGSLRSLIDRKLEERPKAIKQFTDLMNKDISALISDVGCIKDECLQPWLYDIESNPEEVNGFLGILYERLLECVRRAKEYKEFQKELKLEVSRFDILDEVMNDVKLRMLLWESVDSWAKTIQEWYETEFTNLVPDDMNLFIAKNMKSINQLEKGLPKNLIVPKLKEDVEKMRDKMPVVTYLRNPSLKTRHWMKIENVLNHKFKADEVITLELLESLGCFGYPDELMEISGMASSEASLEILLKKVEENWESLEFTVVPHKDTKDVFIMGSTEEVQAVLDDSNINITTISSSRHVGPIKPRVDEWIKQLDLFTKCLEEWSNCQQSWVYLEVIFSAPDIQRQLPTEAKMFLVVDKSWKELMRKTAKMPLAMPAATAPGVYEQLQKNNSLLEQIMKCLESYLETKRVAFPRFYFLSNDELLDILAQTRNPHAVQPHLRKCFDAIAKLEFGTRKITEEEGEEEGGGAPVAAGSGGEKVVLTTDIIAMLSPEGERVPLTKGLKARGNVEDWLGKVEEGMFTSLRKIMKASIGDYIHSLRKDWVLRHPNQIILTVSQIMWAKDVHGVLDKEGTDKDVELKKFETKCIGDLNDLAALVRQDLSSVTRKILIALITVDVHARDTIANLIHHKSYSSGNFEWLKMLRYYWVDSSDRCVTRMSSTSYLYGYEYLGAGGVLVITPLTDKCYLCLMGALQLDLGGAPAGPAGTGKTETTKDLAKSNAVQCVVFNCSEGLDYKMMGRFFSGLAQSGAWCCFDEFNRIDIEVLSVIAQQLITIRNAKLIRAARFMFEGREIKLVQTCAAFITMNPGYAGRTELPDNLKALFRPVSMMVPDYGLIAEVILYSEGFESSKVLAFKMVQMYKLCSEQLSQQDHYDFGMRAVKSVLVMAGSLKRARPDRNEDVVLICALRDSNLPKFLADDAILFQGILTDLFPGVELPVQDYGEFQQTIIAQMVEHNLQPEHCMIKKIIQLHETMIVRWGVMLVGPTGGGKSAILNALNWALTTMHDTGHEGPYYHPVHTYIMNPKAVTAGELYGEVNPFTLEWRDGLMGIMVRTAVQDTSEDHQWIICDGPVDAVWIENLNTVLDDNKMLCLANSERIKLTPYVHFVFEVMDLSQASPATVSRCGMVYVDPEEMRWFPYVRSWSQELSESIISPEMKDYLLALFERYVDGGLTYVRKYCLFAIHQVEISKIMMLCALIKSFLIAPGAVDRIAEKAKIRNFICQTFIFSYIWAVGGNLVQQSMERLEQFIRDQFEDNPDARLPQGNDLWEVYVDVKAKKMEPWNKIMPEFKYDKEIPFFEMLVPTTDTVRFGFVMEQLVTVNYSVMYTGETGVGKSVVAKVVLNKMSATGLYVPGILNFSAQTSSAQTQEILELKLERKKKTLLGAPAGKKIIIFVDDVNMPKLETYGAQAPIELLRQFLDFGGLYDREKLFWKEIKDVVICVGCAPPGGGRNPLTPRFTRHFGMLLIPPPNEYSLKQIFKAILKGFFKDFAQPIQDLADAMINAAVEIYARIAVDLLPTPAKSHYVFNLRDLSKCVQGVLQADSGTMREVTQILRLFYHECLRVFHDRLINKEDKSYFYFLMRETCGKCFANPVLQLPTDTDIIETPPVLLFGDFIVMGADKENRFYDEMKDIVKLKNVLNDYLDDYNLMSSKQMDLIFFMDAIEHTCRIARILRSERGNGLMVGVGGMGKQSLTRLSSHVNAYKCFQIELTRNYDHSSFFDDLRRFYTHAGVLNEDTVFLFTDTQIVQEGFLEDVNNILNSGDVPNLFETDELEKVIIGCRPGAKEAGISESNRDAIYTFFISRVRANLHLVICMSPVGDAFRRRCRMFPSLVNCCTINWFVKWPEEALLSVAQNQLKEIIHPDLVENFSQICVLLHKSVEDMTERFYNEVRRHYYTTPSSYLELLKLYKNMLAEKKESIINQHDRIANGLKKLYETNSVIDSMKETLQVLEPQLVKKSAAVAELMKHLATEQKSADKVRDYVKADEAVAKVQAEETQALADEAQKDLATVLPAMEMASKALDSLNKSDINELRVFQKPPEMVKFVMEAVLILLGSKTDWNSAKQVMADVNFLKKLQEYDKNHMTEAMLKKIKPYIENKNFVPEIIEKVSKVCKSMCLWVRAIDQYAKVYKVVEPKRKKLEAAETELNQVMTLLREKQQKLADVEAFIQKLQDQFNQSIAEKQALEDDMALTAARLVRAGRLNLALGDEQIRWEQSVEDAKNQLVSIVGDIILAAACVAYIGAFTNNYRVELTDLWVRQCEELKIPHSPNFSLINVLADPYDIRTWQTCGLPRDNVSTENAIMVTKAGRWPLMIDPQEQANRWIKQMETPNELKIVKLTDSGFMRALENAIRIGLPVLLQEVGETLDPTLGPVLLKQTFVQSGRLLIHLGDSDVDYDTNFRFYVTTKLANPHYLPEVCIQVTLVNFTVTPSGLEDQLLADVVRLERPELEQQRTELIVRINNDKSTLKNIEVKILRLLYQSEGNILDDEELIDTLNESKETSEVIAARLIEAETTEEKITIAREKYRSVATRGSILYFVVAQLGDIDPMYQYSLKYFNTIFNTVIETSQKNDDLNIRLQTLYAEITLAVYTNISRGLFERHKLVYSFMLCVAIYRQNKTITDKQWNYLLRGPVGAKKELPPKPNYPQVSDNMWVAVNYLYAAFDLYNELPDEVTNVIHIMVGDYSLSIQVVPTLNKDSPINWEKRLNDMEKLMLIKTLCEEKLVFAITEYVKKNLGKAFIESPAISLNVLYHDINNVIPLIFVLSTGSDPFGAFQRFAAEMGFTDRIRAISLGQGQGPVAEKLLATGIEKGDWVFLQNCHLATSWMLSMERIILKIAENPDTTHKEFRLYLSSMPSKTFPVSVLQNSVKVTNEPPKGLRANLRRAYLDMTDDLFLHPFLKRKWKAMVFGLCMFHAVIQERKKFGPLGWNIVYEFNDSDRDFAFNTLKMYCATPPIPWDALIYITGEITYGGRVTDNWDLRCLKTILSGFFAPAAVKKKYVYSKSGTYYCPVAENIEEYREFINQLPLIEEPEIFGMHENANIAFQVKETQAIIRTIMESQPRAGGSGGGKSSDEIVFELSEMVLETIIKKISMEEPFPSLMKKDDQNRMPSLTTVLLQEVDRFNKLLKLIDNSMINLQKAIKGLVVMSEQLEEVFNAFINNSVPKLWSSHSYPSLKSLGSWVHDLDMRTDFICVWIRSGHPTSYWISGFYFPQGFLTGTLQTHARKYNLPIDQLRFEFNPLKRVVDQEDLHDAHVAADGKEVPKAYGDLVYPKDGVIVHGLFLDAGRWDMRTMCLVDPNPGEINPPLPAFRLEPTVSKLSDDDKRYLCPLYKTSIRAGVLSTTGHSTNFVLPFLLPSQEDSSYWILKGTALLTQITN